MRTVLIVWILFFIYYNTGISQSTFTLKSRFIDGEYLCQYEEYLKAIQAYTEYKNLFKADEVYGINLSEWNIETCKNAGRLMKFPIEIKETSLEKPINNRYSEYHQAGLS